MGEQFEHTLECVQRTRNYPIIISMAFHNRVALSNPEIHVYRKCDSVWHIIVHPSVGFRIDATHLARSADI